jgi:hypothetical protein
LAIENAAAAAEIEMKFAERRQKQFQGKYGAPRTYVFEEVRTSISELNED